VVPVTVGLGLRVPSTASDRRTEGMRIGSQDVLLPTTMVGNYPNPRWYDGQAYAVYPKGELIYDAISREAHEDASGAVVPEQQAAGLDIICDGRVNGGDSPYGQSLYHDV